MKEQKTLSWAESGGALPMLHLHLQFKNYLRQSSIHGFLAFDTGSSHLQWLLGRIMRHTDVLLILSTNPLDH